MMETEGKNQKLFLIAGGILLCLVVFLNPWITAKIFYGGRQIEASTKVSLVLFDIVAVALGTLFIVRRRILRLKIVFFWGVSIVVALCLIEGMLHIFFLFVPPPVDPAATLAVYKDKPWAVEYFKELHKSEPIFDQFIGWRRREYHGAYINVASDGARLTWNPQVSTGTRLSSVYIFGGSTVWGIGARDEYTLPSQISKYLNSKGARYTVTNYGENGYTFNQDIVRLTVLLREGKIPDYIIFYDGINDIYGTYQKGMAGYITNYDLLLRRNTLTTTDLLYEGLRNLVKDNCLMCQGVARGLAAFLPPSDRYVEAGAHVDENALRRLAQDTAQNYKDSIPLLNHLAQAYHFHYLLFWEPVLFTEKSMVGDEKNVDVRLGDGALGKLHVYTNELMPTGTLPNFYNVSDVLANRSSQMYIDFAHLTEDGYGMVAQRLGGIFEKALTPGSI